MVDGVILGTDLLHPDTLSTGTRVPGNLIGTAVIRRQRAPPRGAATTTTVALDRMETVGGKAATSLGIGMRTRTTHVTRTTVPADTAVTGHITILQKTRPRLIVTVNTLRLGLARNKVKNQQAAITVAAAPAVHLSHMVRALTESPLCPQSQVLQQAPGPDQVLQQAPVNTAAARCHRYQQNFQNQPLEEQQRPPRRKNHQLGEEKAAQRVICCRASLRRKMFRCRSQANLSARLSKNLHCKLPPSSLPPRRQLQHPVQGRPPEVNRRMGRKHWQVL